MVIGFLVLYVFLYNSVMQKIKGIGFDLGGVVMASAVPHFFNYSEQAFGVSHQEFLEAFYKFQPALERGEITTENFWKAIAKDLGKPYNADKDLHLWTTHFIEDSPIRKEMLALADRLKANGYRVGMLSNTTTQHVAINTTREIFSHFDVALMSNEIHLRKPEPESYHELAQRLGLKTEELVFVDDLDENVAGADAVGMHGIKYEGYAPLVKQLRMLGVDLE